MDVQQEITSIEEELVALIAKHLEENKIELEKAEQLARDFLAVLPISSQADLLKKLKELGSNYDEARELYLEELVKVNKSAEEQKLEQMRDYIKNGDIENAIAVAKAT